MLTLRHATPMTATTITATLTRAQRGKLSVGDVFRWDGRVWRVVHLSLSGMVVVGEEEKET